MEHKTARFLISLMTVLLVCGAVAIAQTPDGETPSAETTCDHLKDSGYTPGLYGLCVAFCEALDGETYDPLGVCNEAPVRLLKNYNRIKSESDPEMPCLKPACPCFDADDLGGFKGCKVGVFPVGNDCYYRDVNGPGIATTYMMSQSAGPFCYLDGKKAALSITPEEAAACLTLLEENNSGSCILQKMMCEK